MQHLLSGSVSGSEGQGRKAGHPNGRLITAQVVNPRESYVHSSQHRGRRDVLSAVSERREKLAMVLPERLQNGAIQLKKKKDPLFSKQAVVPPCYVTCLLSTQSITLSEPPELLWSTTDVTDSDWHRWYSDSWLGPKADGPQVLVWVSEGC